MCNYCSEKQTILPYPKQKKQTILYLLLGYLFMLYSSQVKCVIIASGIRSLISVQLRLDKTNHVSTVCVAEIIYMSLSFGGS